MRLKVFLKVDEDCAVQRWRQKASHSRLEVQPLPRLDRRLFCVLSTANFRAHVNIVSLLTYLLTYLLMFKDKWYEDLNVWKRAYSQQCRAPKAWL